MASFTCPHLDVATDRCLLLKVECVPGRPGCVLRRTSNFAVSAERRIVPKPLSASSPPPPKRRRRRTLRHPVRPPNAATS